MVLVIALLTTLGVMLAGVGLGQIPGIPTVQEMLSALTARAGTGSAMSRSTPTTISIPSIGVRADTIEVGRAANGSIDTPDTNPLTDAGWYQLGPAPGEAGTAIIVGHVDTANKAAVFARLSRLRVGKLIEVRRSDRRVAAFVVDSVETFPKSSFPRDRVFTNGGPPRLVLVTCGGPWVGGDLGYADNVIVFARLT